MTTTFPSISRIGVVGAGMMGAGIAEICARSGADVVVVETEAAAAARGQGRIHASLHHAVCVGDLESKDMDTVMDRLRFSLDPAALTDRELVIEAVPEGQQMKLALFTLLDKIVADDNAILATNTSSIPIARLAGATSRPHAVVGMHFSNPVTIMRLVELVGSLVTAPETLQRARHFASDQLRKVVITSTDRAGFVLNALLIPFLVSAIRMFESGFATADDIDTALASGANHPMGPLALSDLIGLDTLHAVATSLYQEFKEPHYAPPPLLSRMVETGMLGRKSGSGFFPYQNERSEESKENSP